MSTQKPSLPKGTRDFGPDKMIKRNFILDTIKHVFKKFGFLPLETPAMENLSVLTGKYGDEGDQLIFKILNSGDYLNNLSPTALEDGHKKLTPQISEKALKYDLTVPFARFVVMNRNDIAFPFKRYQVQPVWRADRPQKGRYREFYQCDADVVGTNSLLCEAEIVLMINEVFAQLGISDFTIKMNNRKLLQGIVEKIGKQGEETTLCVAIDKLDKIGKQGVIDELVSKGFTTSDLEQLMPLFELKGDSQQLLATLKTFFASIPVGMEGIGELEQVLAMVDQFGLKDNHVEIDLSLARGLSYYTGAIFEVKANNVQMGSISGGGRYDNLTGVFGMPGVSGVGISFGVDRIYDVLEELNLFPEDSGASTKVLITYFDQVGFTEGLPLLKKLRDKGIFAELYPEVSKPKKQFEYADKKRIPFVIVLGEDEIKSGILSLKDMNSGQQERLSLDDIISKLN